MLLGWRWLAQAVGEGPYISCLRSCQCRVLVLWCGAGAGLRCCELAACTVECWVPVLVPIGLTLSLSIGCHSLGACAAAECCCLGAYSVDMCRVRLLGKTLQATHCSKPLAVARSGSLCDEKVENRISTVSFGKLLPQSEVGSVA